MCLCQQHIPMKATCLFRFGAKFASEKTGIVYNNEIADAYTLSSPWRKFSWSEENAPRPRSRPLSAMAPTILTDDDGNVRMVIGASGGAKITSSVAWVSCSCFRIYF